jgi:hypothetical protein
MTGHCHECRKPVDDSKPMAVRIYVRTARGDIPLCVPCWGGADQQASVPGKERR